MSISIFARTVMPIVYLGCGLFLLIGKNIFDFTDLQKYGLSIIMIGYGIFRLFISVKKIREMRNEEQKN